MKQNGHKGIAGMFLWDIDFEYDGYSNTISKTIIIATRHKTVAEANKKALRHLHQFRYDYPKAKLLGVSYHGLVHA